MTRIAGSREQVLILQKIQIQLLKDSLFAPQKIPMLPLDADKIQHKCKTQYPK